MQMNSAVQIVCPKCKGELEELDTTSGRCRACGLRYRIIADIVDLRYPVSELEPDPEMVIAERLMTVYTQSRYLDLVEIYFASLDVSTVPRHLVSYYKDHRSQQLSRGSQLTSMFLARLRKYYDLPDHASALEIGCGEGAGLVALSQNFEYVIGVDPSLPELILARKFCDDNGIKNIRLVRAYGQQLPFPDNGFSYVTAQNTLEHVFDIDGVVAEVARVLKCNGCFAADSRNRYDLFFPEPHVKLRWVGWLPRAWANAYVQWRIGMSYDMVHTRLLSYGDLRVALRKSFGDYYQIVVPNVSAYDIPAFWDIILASLERFEWLRQWLVVIFPTHLALAKKRDSDW